MAKERRDNKNRLLHTGEYQRSDGRYEYKYIDSKGAKRSVYSWKLVQSDKTPKGKQPEMCLREMEKQIVRDNQDEIDGFTAKRMTLNHFFDIHIAERRLKDSTRTNYKYMYKKYVSEGLGRKNISDIKYSDIKRFYSSLIFEKGFKPRSMEVINTIIHPIFTTAVRDGYIRLNPSDGVMNEIKKSAMWDTPHRTALTVEQQEAFVNFTSNSKQYNHWMPLFTVLLGTGGRIGEIVGLRWEDCDFEENIISINHTLIYRLQDDGTCKFQITTPKTRAGIREIPMFDEVRETLKNEYMRQSITGFNKTVVDGYSGFIFQNRFGKVYSPHAVNRGIERIRNAYNEFEAELSKKEHREANLLPHFSCHHLRHTFCTRMCENTSDQNTLKMIQVIMGHSDISTTLDVYTDLTRKKKKEAFAFLQDKMKIW